MSTKSLFKFIFYMGTYVMLALPVFRLHKLEKAALLNSKTKHLTFYHFQSHALLNALQTVYNPYFKYHTVITSEFSFFGFRFSVFYF